MERIIKELEKIIIEVGNIEETKTYFKKTVFKNPQEIKNEVMELLNDRISELKEQ